RQAARGDARRGRPGSRRAAFHAASRLAASASPPATARDTRACREADPPEPPGLPATQVATARRYAAEADREAAGPAPPSTGSPGTTSGSRRETPTGRAQAGAASGNAAPPRPVARRPERAGGDLCGGRRGARRAARVRVTRARVPVLGVS